jgi:hypothetical protein
MTLRPTLTLAGWLKIQFRRDRILLEARAVALTAAAIAAPWKSPLWSGPRRKAPSSPAQLRGDRVRRVKDVELAEKGVTRI